MGENRGGSKDTKDGEENMVNPGFRFHPTDEELLGFYLQRKVQRKSIAPELIKEVDIYKYDPWDLPKMGGIGSRDKEWYFFCMRGRKYRNSVRPNRVTQTGTGFWKATGIDKPIYPTSTCSKKCIGLKKSLVYYIGNAGKGTKTEWMMHEYRFPPSNQEAEVWTLCRIFKKETSFNNFTPDTKTTARNENLQEKRSGNFSNTPEVISVVGSPIASPRSDLWTASNDNGFFGNGNGNWDELGSVIRFHAVQ